MSDEDLDKETIGRKVSKKYFSLRTFRVKKLIFKKLAESLPFDLLEEYREIFSFFDRWLLSIMLVMLVVTPKMLKTTKITLLTTTLSFDWIQGRRRLNRGGRTRTGDERFQCERKFCDNY